MPVAASPIVIPLDSHSALDVLGNVEGFLQKAAIVGGSIAVLVGVIMNSFTRKSSDRSQMAWSFIIGGIIAIVVGAGIAIIKRTAQAFTDSGEASTPASYIGPFNPETLLSTAAPYIDIALHSVAQVTPIVV